MRVYRKYTCESWHDWVICRQDTDPELPQDTLCPYGHEAVTRRDEPPADEVQLLLRPAARIIDSVTGRLGLEKRYWLVLLDREDAEIAVSKQHYTWDEVVQLAMRYRGLDKARALERWNPSPP